MAIPPAPKTPEERTAVGIESMPAVLAQIATALDKLVDRMDTFTDALERNADMLDQPQPAPHEVSRDALIARWAADRLDVDGKDRVSGTELHDDLVDWLDVNGLDARALRYITPNVWARRLKASVERMDSVRTAQGRRWLCSIKP